MRVGIIGAGMMGLTIGYRLSQEGHYVEIIETRDQPGGLSTWFDYEYFLWDKYYHVILKQDEHLLKLIDELGLNDRLQWTNTLTGFLWNKQLVSMSNYWEFLQFPPLNIFEKFRLGIGILYSRHIQKSADLKDKTAEVWLKKVFGNKVFSAIWEPLLESKYGTLKPKIPAELLWATINRYYGTRNKGDGKEWMGYLKGGGLKVIIETLIDKISQNNGCLRCGEKVLNISDSDSDYLSVKTDKNTYQYDRLISTVPTFIFHKFLPRFTEKARLTPQYLGVIRLALIMDQSLSPYYVTNLIDKDLPYTGIIELSRVVDKEEFGGKNLIMIPRYDIPSSEWFKMSDEEIKNRFLMGLKRTWPSIEEHILKSYVHREPIVQGIWINASPHLEPEKSSDERIWSINAELAGSDNLNNNAIVKVANKAVIDFQSREMSHV